MKIELEVTLNDQNHVEDILWKSEDPPSKGVQQRAKGFFLSLFDADSLETLKIDLWTSTFEIGEMNRLTYYTLRSLGDSFYKATNNEQLGNDLARFAQYFGEESGVIPKSG